MSFSKIAATIRSTEAEFRKLKTTTAADKKYKENALKSLEILGALTNLKCFLLNSDPNDPDPSLESSLPSLRKPKGNK